MYIGSLSTASVSSYVYQIYLSIDKLEQMPICLYLVTKDKIVKTISNIIINTFSDTLLSVLKCLDRDKITDNNP